ncbi:MAG TPA: hypothetical protein VGY91_00095 [Chthoniobacterales bacterium]|jgi:DNA topoisomerase IB|nr:hypothetical protein [Chthoniobacterales bacterium]
MPSSRTIIFLLETSRFQKRLLKLRRSGENFVYLDVNGGAIRDDEIVTRIKALAIPPAWAKVWICPVVWLRHRELIPR